MISVLPVLPYNPAPPLLTKLRDYVTNHKVQKRTRVLDIIIRIVVLKWNFNGTWSEKETKDTQKGGRNGDYTPTRNKQRQKTHMLERQPRKDCKQLFPRNPR